MRVLHAAAVFALLAGPAYGQSQTVPRYGEPDKTKSAQEIADEKEAEKAYKRSLGNIPEKAPTDPWGTVRSDGASKTADKSAAKTPPAKRTKTDSPVK